MIRSTFITLSPSTPVKIGDPKTKVTVQCGGGGPSAYLGGADISDSNGYILEADLKPLQLVLGPGEELWALSALGTSPARVRLLIQE